MLMMNWGLIDEGIPFLTEKWHWAVTYLLVGVWQTMGWGTIIYLAAITGISGELYEGGHDRRRGALEENVVHHAARHQGHGGDAADHEPGQGDEQQPGTSAGFCEQPGKRLSSTSSRFTFYEKGLNSGQFSEATAVGLFQSLVGLFLVLASDRVAKGLGEDGLL